MPSVKLWSTEEGKLVDFELTGDNNGEIVATYKDESLKFPAVSKDKFLKLVAAHNEANEGVKAVDPDDAGKSSKKVQDLLEAL